MSNDWVYDLETYPNVFTMAAEHADAPIKLSYEISDQRNDSAAILAFVQHIQDTGGRMVGFNNLGFDYPVLHTLIRMGCSDAATLYTKAMAIIQGQDDDDRWMHTVKPTDRVVPQIDLFKIHHFDNKARATGLKALEFNMRADSIEDLPFPVGTVLTPEQIVVLKRYNAYDTAQTKAFLGYTREMIAFREEMTRLHPGNDWVNFNDTKIGKEFFILKLEESGIPCYDFGPKGRTPRQTPRPQIKLRDAILPWIKFEQSEFNRVLNWLREQVITETKGVFEDLSATINGFSFVFGTGGIHGSVESEIIESDDEYTIVDLDVTSYYPTLAIVNEFFPAHLGKAFCYIYKDLFEQRKKHPKKSAISAMLKLALNGVYGDSNNRFSVFYDPLYTMTITLNGQLLLCLLAEMIMKIEGVRLIQVNTDGLTARVRRDQMAQVEHARTEWQRITGLQLEEAIYKSMMIRDVNNYIAVYEDGGVKRKGAYEWKVQWHQNAGGLVIPKVVEKVLVDGAPIRETVENWPDIMDFMLRVKVPRSSHLVSEVAGQEPVKQQNTCRYYIAKGGASLFKWMPPTARTPDKWRKIGVESGWGVQICNDIRDAGKLPIDFEYYIREVEKLCLGLA